MTGFSEFSQTQKGPSAMHTSAHAINTSLLQITVSLNYENDVARLRGILTSLLTTAAPLPMAVSLPTPPAPTVAIPAVTTHVTPDAPMVAEMRKRKTVEAESLVPVPPAPPLVQPPAVAAVVIDPKTVYAAVENFARTKGVIHTSTLLKKHGATCLSKVPESAYPALMADITEGA